MSIRVRYAPSPTGYQHLGGIRTALVNFLFARSQSGAFIVRVEDTDRTRTHDDYLQDLFDSLSWLGISIDEHTNTGQYKPYIQSQRKELYVEHVRKLLAQGQAYYCFTTATKQSSGSTRTTEATHDDTYIDKSYDRSSRNLTPQEIAEYRAQGIVPVVRLKMPLEGEIIIEDELLGNISREVKDIIIDPILLKSDGFPTYHLANVVDDHFMQISHVIRSQEWIPSIPVHVYLYKCFGWTSPKFCHLPLVLGDDGQKLSKRNGSLSVRAIRAMGILPQALINYIVLLGWAFDDSREFFTLDELIELFQKGKLNVSPSKFSMSKLRWFNAHYIRKLEAEELCTLLMPYFIEKQWLHDTPEDFSKLQQLCPLVQERLEVLSEATNLLSCVFEEVNTFAIDELISKHGKEILKEGVLLSKEVLQSHWDQSVEEIESIIRARIKDYPDKKLKLGQVLMPLRVAVTGNTVSPPILPLIKVIGLEKVIERIDRIIKHL